MANNTAPKARAPYLTWALAFIFTGILIRLAHVDLPLYEGAYSRQMQTATITRNFAREGLDFLHPQLDLLPQPRYFLLESPLYSSIVAILYKLVGEFEFLGRLASIMAFAGTAVILFRLASNLINPQTGRAAVFIFSFSPLSIIFTRAFQPDSLALFLSTACIYYFAGWMRGQRHFILACACGILTALCKQTYLFILLPLFLYGLYCRGKDILLDYKFYIFFLSAISPAIAWAAHARHISLVFPTLMMAVNMESANWWDFSTFLNYEFYKNIFNWISGLTLTPAGFALFLTGLFVRSNKPADALTVFWLLGVITYDLILHKHIYTHEYYHLPLLPIASLIAGKAWWAFFEQDRATLATFFRFKGFKIIAGAVTAAMIFGYSNSGFKIPASLRNATAIASALNKFTKDDDPLVVTDALYLYLGDNKGWELNYYVQHYGLFLRLWPQTSQALPHINLLEIWRQQGAAYFLHTAPDELYQNQEFSRHILERYPVIAEQKGEFILFDLRPNLTSSK